CMTEISSLLIQEGMNISSDILIVDEMVMKLCQL
ncbi:energy-coupling factor transporter ATPase, partial [Clostridioides difficile]|nr:energy-coupling factor transporter ATPase [Clostridioides difficile]